MPWKPFACFEITTTGTPKPLWDAFDTRWSLAMEEHKPEIRTCARVKVGIGLPEGDPREGPVLASATFCPVLVFRRGAELLDALDAGDIDAGVRGALPSHEFLNELRSRRKSAAPRRAALIVTAAGRPLLLGPVGIDEGGTVESMGRLVKDMREACGLLGWEPRIAVLSAGRPGDEARSPRVARSIRRGRLTAERHGVRHCHIMIEEAAEWANCVIAPDGVSGNLIYRALAHLGGAVSLGAFYFPLSLRLADTSRSGTVDEFVGAIALANLAASAR